MICANCLRKEEVEEILFWHFEVIIEWLELEVILNIISNLSSKVVQSSIQSGFEHFQDHNFYGQCFPVPHHHTSSLIKLNSVILLSWIML